MMGEKPRVIPIIPVNGAFNVLVRYICPVTHKLVTVQPLIRMTGYNGCCCQESCYCDTPEVEAEIEACPQCGKRHVMDIKYYGPRDPVMCP